MKRCLLVVFLGVGFVPRAYSEQIPPSVMKLFRAVQQDDLNKVREALNEGADVNYLTNFFNIPVIVLAAKGCNAQIVEELLTHPKSKPVINLNILDKQFGRTAYSYAQDRCPAIADRLLKAGALTPAQMLSPEAKQSVDQQLVAAIQAGNQAGVQAALTNGANPEAKTADGKTLLHQAAMQGNKAIVEFLIKDGKSGRYAFDINAKDNEGKTALHYAAARGIMPILEALIQGGAGLNIEDNSKKTPVEYADQLQEPLKTQIRNALFAAGAD